jgi:hypothetical protein
MPLSKIFEERLGGFFTVAGHCVAKSNGKLSRCLVLVHPSSCRIV